METSLFTDLSFYSQDELNLSFLLTSDVTNIFHSVKYEHSSKLAKIQKNWIDP